MRRWLSFVASHSPLLVGYVVAYYIPHSPIATIIIPFLVLLYPGLMLVRLPDLVTATRITTIAYGTLLPLLLANLGVWAILGWVLASITDWRQTKHLMLTIVPMAALGGLIVSSLGNRGKRLVLGLCLAAGICNVLRILQLLFNFDSLPPSTVW
jgi:hypothetical protein